MKIKLAKSEVIHFVGIGGIGMSGLSLIMKGKGFKVQGSDILSNKNLNADIKLKVKDVTNIDELNNLFLKTNIKQGDIGFSGSNINWRDSVKIP